jgi:hypothetical protein
LDHEALILRVRPHAGGNAPLDQLVRQIAKISDQSI